MMQRDRVDRGRWWVVGLMLLAGSGLALGACDGDTRSGDGQEGEGEAEGQGGLPDGGLSDGSVDSGPEPPPLFPEEEFELVFIGEDRQTEVDPALDLYVVRQMSGGQLETLREQELRWPGEDFLNVTEGTLRCETCRFNADRSWLIWTDRKQDLQGYTMLKAAPIDAGWVINQNRKKEIHTFRPPETFRDAVFAADHLVYGIGRAPSVDVMSYDLTAGSEHALGTMPDGGSLRVTPDGRQVILQEQVGLNGLRIRTVSPVGQPSPRVIQNFSVVGTTTGSDYDGKEPSAVSPDGKWLALLTEARPSLEDPAEFRINIVSLGQAGSEGLVSHLRLGAAGPGKCDTQRKPNEFNTSEVNPIWSPDGRYVYILGKSEPGCGVPIMQDVNDTDILRLEVLSNGTLGELANVTANPEDNWPALLSMRRMALSPKGEYFVVSAIPEQSIKDTELYVFSAHLPEIRLGDPTATFADLRFQLTNNRLLDVNDIWLFPVAGQ